MDLNAAESRFRVSHLRQNGQSAVNLGLVNGLTVDKIALPTIRLTAGDGKRQIRGVQLEP